MDDKHLRGCSWTNGKTIISWDTSVGYWIEVTPKGFCFGHTKRPENGPWVQAESPDYRERYPLAYWVDSVIHGHNVKPVREIKTSEVRPGMDIAWVDRGVYNRCVVLCVDEEWNGVGDTDLDFIPALPVPGSVPDWSIGKLTMSSVQKVYLMAEPVN